MNPQRLLIGLALTLAACPKSSPTAAPEAARVERPAPLPERPFKMPEVSSATLSNGIRVQLAPNHEVPLFEVRLLVNMGSWNDPEGKEGLYSVTLDLMDTAAGDRDSQQLARTLNSLGGSVGAGGGLTRGSVSASGLVRNFEPILDVWADVLLRPSFPEDEWTLERSRRIAAVERRKDDPNAIANTVFDKLVYGNAYAGRETSVASYNNISLDDMKALHAEWIRPEHTTILVAGDLDIDTVVAALEARLGSWTSKTPAETPRPEVAPADMTPTMYFVDKPGAAQSVVQTAILVDGFLAEDRADLMLANTAFGGAFTARVNMNLREDKGYTYGARCGIMYRHGPGVWYCSTSVSTPTTGPSLIEIRKELDEARADRPITDEEIAFFKAFRVNAYPRQFETSGALLGEWANMWTHNLPDDWLERYVPSIQAVETSNANDAFRRWIDPSKMMYVVVGDGEVIRDDLEAFGLPVVELDTTGAPVETP